MTTRSPITLRDIAALAHVNVSTVSRALSNNPQIPESTRERVREAARSLGYRPNPYVRAFTTYVRNRRTPERRATIAVLDLVTPPGTKPAARTDAQYGWVSGYIDALKRRATELGFHIDVFRHRPVAEELAALDRVLYNRGIRGIVILPTPENTLPPGLRLDRLACATIDLSLRTPNLPRATPDYFAATVLAMEKLTQKGYRRIGFYSNDLEIRRIGDRWLGGVLFAQQMLPEAARVPPLILATSTDPDPDRSWAKMREAFFVWLNREKPDVILANSLYVVLWLEEAGCRIPQDVGFASLSACLTSPVGHWNNENIHSMAGINQQTDLVAAQALDLVANQIFNNEFGLPESAPMVLIPPLWKDGETLAR